MKNLLKLCLSLLLFGLANPVAAQGQIDAITSFHSSITINRNTSLSIVETLTHQTTLHKHGIYRYIPFRYSQNGYSYTRSINAIRVTDENHQPQSYTQTQNGEYIMLKIGDPDQTYTGTKTYIISYIVSNGINRLRTHDELYWDITGEGWQIPVLKSSATISSPHAVITDSVCYSGIFGGNDNLCTITHTEAGAEVTYDQVINYNDNLTIALKLDQNNQLQFPGTAEKAWRFILDNLLLFLIPLPLVIMFLLWNTYGRDYESVSGNIYDLDPNQPKKRRPLLAFNRIPFVYEPLKMLTPGETGAILDEKVDSRDIIADIIDFARKKYLTIERKEDKVLFITTTDYVFTRLVEKPTDLSEYQELLFTRLFASGDIVTLSHLKGTFYTTMQEVSGLIDKNLTVNQFYTHNPNHSRALGLILWFFLNGGLMGLVFMFSATLPPLWPYGLILLQAVIGFILGYNLTQKTVVGNNLMLQAKGLRHTINTGKWRQEIQEKHLFIEEVLPFAISLGVIDKLARDMDDLNLKPPEYVSNWSMSSMHWSSMVSDFSSSAGSSLSYNPSSSRSGGSGFSGGSSGGGGGGGGGGSW